MPTNKADEVGPHIAQMINIMANLVSAALSDPVRKEMAAKSLSATYFDIDRDDIPDAGSLPEDIKRDQNILANFISLYSIAISFGETQYYFRRYPFHDLPVSKGDHLRNICEMYFDRISQFRDRLKACLNIIKLNSDLSPNVVSDIIKWFDKKFSWEIKQRNFTHHHGRFEYHAIERLNINHILRYTESFDVINSDQIYRKEVRLWVKRVQNDHKILNMICDNIAKITLDNCDNLRKYAPLNP